jgi:L-alanine-DL-glutamate epimerase-like enolase superfamily enzyme
MELTQRKGSSMKITNVRLRELTGILQHPDGPFWEERLIRPVDVYPEYHAQNGSETNWQPIVAGETESTIVLTFIEIETDEGVTGVGGPLAREVATLIHTGFREFLVGHDPLATERLWDIMYRHGVHSRKGTPMFAISAIDAALWDLRGKYLNQSVHVLLGGPVRTRLPAYASMLGFSLEPDKLEARASAYVARGYTAQKWFPRWGPMEGREGIRKNIELMEILRASAGPESDIMIDAWMSWDVPYTLDMVQRLKPYDPRWLEEPVLPDKVAQYAEIRAKSVVQISGGEHEYTRYGIKALLDARAVDLMQADTYWAGGISEMVKICILCSAYDVPIVPHGHSVPANVQLSAALSPVDVPYVEFLVKWNDILQFFYKQPVVPVDGYVTVPTGPGMGVEIDESKIASEREFTVD